MTKMFWGLAALNLASAAINWYFATQGHTFNLVVAIFNTLAAAVCVAFAAGESRAF